MPKRRKPTGAQNLRRLFVAPGILLFGSLLGPNLVAGEPSRNNFEPVSVSVSQSENFLGQHGLNRFFSSPKLLPMPQSRRLKTFDFVPDYSARRYRTWIRAFGHWSSLESGRRTQDLEYYSYGISFGVDQQIGRRLLLGLALGGNQVTVRGREDTRENRLKSDVSAAHGSVYFRTTLEQIYFDLEAGLGYNDQSEPSRNSLQWNIHAEAGTWWGHGLGRVEPFLGLRHASLDVDPGTETKTTLIGGIRYSWKTTGAFAVTTPRFYGGVLHELGDRNLMNAALFVDAPTVFAIPGYEIGETRFFLGGGFTSAMGRSLDLYLRYTAEIASDQTSHTAMLGMNWNF